MTDIPNRAQSNLISKPCETCGKLFQPYRDHQRTCSRQCYDRLPDRKESTAAFGRRVDVKARKNAARRLETATDPKMRREINRRSALARYGITPEQYDEQVERQRGRCMICGRIPDPSRPKPANRLHVDHDHETGVRRDLLCSRCNTAIGLMADDPELFRAAADYIERHREV